MQSLSPAAHKTSVPWGWTGGAWAGAAARTGLPQQPGAYGGVNRPARGVHSACFFSSQYYLRPTVHHLLSGRALRLQLFYTSAHASRCNSMEYCVAAIVNSNDMQSPWPAMDNAYLLITCYPPRLPTIRYPLMQHYPTLAWTSFKV